MALDVTTERATEGAGGVPGTEATWEPRIVALLCNWCSYAGADMAGTTRRIHAPNVRIIRFLCTGRMDPLFIVKAFEQGADGVLLSGCHPGDCHYVQGNLLARRRMTVFRALMDLLGLDQRRLHLAWVSASEGAKWSRIVDEVTAAVREAGPIGRWARPASSEAGAGLLPRHPEETAPRSPPTPEEAEAVTAHLRRMAADLLDRGEVSLVLGYTEGSLPGQMVPAFAARPEEAEALAWNERCGNNLAVYLRRATRERPQGRVAAVVKSCDARTVAALQGEGQLERERVVLIGVRCAGVWDDGCLAAKCYACREEVSPLVDWTVTAAGATPGAAPSGAERAVAPDPRDRELATLEARQPEERWDWWQRQFERCLRCYACRAVCPMCYCDVCISERHRPQWIPTTIDGTGNTAWNVARAMHLAGRCIGCDECLRACPANIRLDLINRRLAREIEARYGFRSDVDAGAPAPLTTFRPDDPDEFL